MTLKYRLEESDYLTFQLYTASKSESVKKKRRKSTFVGVVMFVLASVLFFITNNDFLGYFFSAVTILSALIFPLYLGYLYKKNFRKYVRETWKTRKNEDATVTFLDAEKTIQTYDVETDTKINFTALTAIVELKELIIFTTNTIALVLPKRCIPDVKNSTSYFKSIANSCQINYNEEMDWKWK